MQRFLPTTLPNSFYLGHGAFEYFPVVGFLNTGTPRQTTCEDLLYRGNVRIQRSFHSEIDIRDVVGQIKDHPMVAYQIQKNGYTDAQMMDQSWTKTSSTAIWIEKYKAYLSITRYIFHEPNARDLPLMSFLKGQLYDAAWVEMKGRTVKWHGEQLTFPTIFNITVPYKAGGSHYGPEDPRVVVEEANNEAEPVVLFNMQANLDNPERAVFAYRPFTNDLTMLTVAGTTLRAISDKTFAPFFYRQDQSSTRFVQQTWPMRYLHLVEDFSPLKILKCELYSGQCSRVYEQDVPEKHKVALNTSLTTITGGTNLVAVPMKGVPGVSSFVGFIYNKIEAGCSTGPVSTPQMVILTASSNAHFHLNYLSEPVDFAPALLSTDALANPCGKGRSLVPLGVPRWDRSARQDVMTVAISVSDSTMEIMRVHGLLRFITQLPFLRDSLKQRMTASSDPLLDLSWSAAGNAAVSCALEAAQDYSIDLAHSVVEKTTSVDGEVHIASG